MLRSEGFPEALAVRALVEEDGRVGEIDVGRTLGKSAFSFVFKGTWSLSGETCVLKRISKRDVKTLREIKNLVNEHAALKALSAGPNLLTLQTVFASERYLYFRISVAVT